MQHISENFSPKYGHIVEKYVWYREGTILTIPMGVGHRWTGTKVWGHIIDCSMDVLRGIRLK